MNKVGQGTDAKLGELDQKIVEAIESTGRYKLWGWDYPDYCVVELIFDDKEGHCRMGMQINTYPVEREEDRNAPITQW